MSNVIDLSALPAPTIIDALDFNAIRDAMLADLVSRYTLFTAIVPSDPAYKLIEVFAYRELILRQRMNDAAKAVMLAHAVGNDLENLVAFYGVSRLLIDAGDANAIPPILPTYESDTDLRTRTLFALDSVNTTGSKNNYIFRALESDGSVKNASAKMPSAGNVTVSILSNDGDGTADAALITTVENALTVDDDRPLTDNVTVQSATIVGYTVSAQLYVYSGPDQAEVLTASQVAVQAYVDSMHKIGRDVTQSGLYAALHVAGVQRVVMALPATDVAITDEQAGYCTSITVTLAGVAE